MPRTLRLDYADARHHVMNRGARQTPIFQSEEDCVAFLGLLAAATELFGLRVHAYALQGDHYHLLVSTPRANLAEAVGFLQSRFSRWLNRQRGWIGPLFRGRYRSRLVEDEAWWRHLLAIVHLNPVAAGSAARPQDARWTSHRAYVGLDERPEWLDTTDMVALFGGEEPLNRYVDEVQRGREPGPRGFDAARLWRRDLRLIHPLPAPHTAPRGVEQALAEVGVVTGLSREAVVEAKRGPRGNRARLLAIWWLHEGAGLGTNAIAAQLHADPATVSRTLRRAGRDRGADLEAWKAALIRG